MSATAFTPGPWHLQSDGQVWCDDHPVAEKITTGPWGDEAVDFITGERSLVHHWGTVATEEAKANARLIAAAPELYEALEKAAKRFRDYEQIHRLKGTEEGYLKADNNGDLALYCETALAKAGDPQ